MKKTCYFNLKIIPLIIFLFTGSVAYSQTRIKGVVTEKSGEPVIGATISLKGTTQGVVTDINGTFEYQTEASLPLTIQATYMGFRTEEIDIYDMEELIKITLTENLNYLNEVVVLGYVQQKRDVVTASVSSIKAEDFATVQAAGIDQKLQGKIPGMQVSSNSGAPGTSVSLRIRGTTSINAGNDPLYIVDGVFINNDALQRITNGGQVVNALADLNPNDIENIEVLKDANATSIYGARGANGVIIITTKRGKLNSKTNISAGFSLGWSKVRKSWDMVTGPQYAELTNEVYLNDGGNPSNLPYPNPEKEPTYVNDKLDDIFRTGLQQNYYLNFSGGDAKTTYYLGLDYNQQVGTTKPDDLKRYSFRINLDHNISSKIRIGTSTSLSRTEREIALSGNNTKSPIPSAIYPPSNVSPYYDDGSYQAWGIHDSYLAMINDLDNTSVSNRVVSSLYGEYTIIPNLVFRTNWNMDYNTYDEDVYYPSVTATAAAKQGVANSARSKRQTLINEQTLRYSLSIKDKHNLSFLAGNTIQKNDLSWRSIEASGFPSDDFREIQYASLQTASGNSSQSGLISFFGRVAYDYKSKYIADINIRSDASSRFGKDNKWGTFPSIGAAWNITHEEWFKARWVNELKLRTSYGITGNQNGISDYASSGIWTGGANYRDESGIRPSQLANPELKWETTNQFNIGLDTRFFENRIHLEVNYYNKYTKDLLVNIPIASISGFSSITKNAGEMSNKGFELALNTTNITNKNFEWTSSFNIAHNKNKIERLENAIEQYNFIRMEEGHSMFSFYVYKQLYVDPQTGDAIIEDTNEDGQINADDRQITGNALPKFNGGFDNTFRYKNFDLNIFMSYSLGGKVVNMFQYMLQHGGTRPGWNYTVEQLNRWQKPGDITDVPRMTVSGTNYSLRTSRFVEDGSYLKLRNVTIGYQIPKQVLRKYGISGIRLYATATNLYTFTKYTGPDPEINVAGDNQNVLGIDFATAPSPRSFLFGANINF